MQWQNTYNNELIFQCSKKVQGIVGVVSVHSNKMEDRQWNWKCQEVAKKPLTICSWTSWVNDFDVPFLFQCPANKILTGVRSIHDNSKQDRRWKFRCCGAKHHFTRNCFASNYINYWDKRMDYKVDPPYVFAGVFSYHSNIRE